MKSSIVYFWDAVEWVPPLIPPCCGAGEQSRALVSPTVGAMSPFPAVAFWKHLWKLGAPPISCHQQFCPELHPRSQAAPSHMETHSGSGGTHWARNMDF